MSVLARLLARATGTASSGLTPRLPGRFETAPGSWNTDPPAETDEATVAPASQRPAPAPEPANPAPTPDPGDAGATAPPRPPPLLARAPDQPARPTPPRDAPEAPQVPPMPEAQQATPAEMPPDRPAQEGRPPEPIIASPRSDGAKDRGPEMLRAASPAPPSAASSAPPEPLQPPVAGDMVVQVAAALTPSRQGQTPIAPAPAQNAPQPPDIVIHIGHLDVAAPARPDHPAPPRKQRAERKMTRLGDYLKPNGTSGDGAG